MFSLSTINAQDDNVITEDAWISVKLRTQFDKKTIFDFKPTIRYQEGQAYQNSSLDLSLIRKLDKGWSVAITARTWYLPNGDFRQFFWPIALHAMQIGNFKINQRFMLHYAVDVADQTDDDFLRWQPKFAPNVNWKIKPWIGIEPFFRLNGKNRVERIRYQVGMNVSIDAKTSLSCAYWRQESFYRTPRRINNMFAIALNHNVYTAPE